MRGLGQDGFVIIPGGCLIFAVAVVGLLVLVVAVGMLVRAAWPLALILIGVVAGLSFVHQRRRQRGDRLRPTRTCEGDP